MKLKPGYKQTEVGVIPEEWEVGRLELVATQVASGKSKIQKNNTGSFPVYGSTGIIGYTENPEYEGNAILVARVGANAGTLNTVSGMYGVTDNTIIIRISDIALLPFIVRQLEVQRLNKLVFGSGQPLITGTQLKDRILPLPPLPEQRAIAEALSDVDGLLAGLEKLIAKKRALKQATMQQLLTGQTRLPGFRGEWEVKRLGEVIEKIVGGGTPSRNNSTFWGNEIPWVTVKDFATFTPYQTQESITKMGLVSSASNLIPAGTIIISTRMALGKTVVYEIDVAINQDLKALFLRPTVDRKFMTYWFKANSKVINDLGSGSTVKGIQIGQLCGIPFLSPSLPEQRAIAEILSDMDAEIVALEARREKTAGVKQGMMQELLTGRVRLV